MSVAKGILVVFPDTSPHAASMQRGAVDHLAGHAVVDPLGYVEFLRLVPDSRGVLTDSGGVQEETTYLGVPCFTLRDNTERPVTITCRHEHKLVLDPSRIAQILPALARARPVPESPPGWDGQAAQRVAAVIAGGEAAPPTDARAVFAPSPRTAREG